MKDGGIDYDNVVPFRKAPAPKLTGKRAELNALLAGDAMHVLAWGGSRPGKTVALTRALAIRAIRAPNSRHLIARHRFNHALASMWHDSSKTIRAEPVSVMYAQGKVHHVGHFHELDDEMLSFTTHGFLGDGSPDRVAALGHAIAELYPCMLSAHGQYRQPVVPRSDLPRSVHGNEYAKAQGFVARHKAKMNARGIGASPQRPESQTPRARSLGR